MVGRPFEGERRVCRPFFMLRPLSAPVLGACLLALSACNPVDDPARGETVAEAVAGPGDRVPDGYDWHYTLEGGSGDLDFGDGDWAEGKRLISLSCLPNSQEVRLHLGDEPDVVLTAGTATGTFRNDAPVPANHAVFSALRTGESLSVGSDRGDLTLEGTAEGKRELEAFFAYCTTPLAPQAPAATEPAPEPQPEAAPEPADTVDEPETVPSEPATPAG